jgi:thiamine kinase
MAPKCGAVVMRNITELIERIPALPVVTRTQILSSGSVNDIWLLETASGKFVLRADTSLAGKLGLNRTRELDVLAAANGLAPEVVWADPAAGLLLTRFVRGDVWVEQDFVTGENPARLAALLLKLHSIRSNGLALDYGCIALDYARQIDTPEASLLATQAQELAAAWCSDVGRYVLCHHDVHSGNVIDPGGEAELRLIDWEYAGMGEPYFELAVVLGQQAFTPASEQALLMAYTESLDTARLMGCRHLYSRLSTLWLMLVCAESAAPPAYRQALESACAGFDFAND